jgi:hypothetical protein
MPKILESNQYAGVLEAIAKMCDGLQDRSLVDYIHVGDYFPCVDSVYAVGIVCGSLATMINPRDHDFKNTSFRMEYFKGDYARPIKKTSTKFMDDGGRPVVRFDNFYMDYFQGSSLRGAPIIAPHREDPEREKLAAVISNHRFLFLLGANRWTIEKEESLALNKLRLEIAGQVAGKIGKNVPTELFLIGLVGNVQQTKREGEEKTGVLVKVPFFRVYAREISKRNSAQAQGAKFQEGLGHPERNFFNKARFF